MSIQVQGILDSKETVIRAQPIKFHGGESHVTVQGLDRKMTDVKVLARIQSASDLVELMLIEDVLQRFFKGDRTLTIPYLPYARQDRVTEETTAFSLRQLAAMLNLLNYDAIFTYDVHSDVAAALLPKLVNITQGTIISQFAAMDSFLKSDFAFVAPDAGATKKVQKLADMYKKPMVQAIKTRDVTTGTLGKPQVIEATVPHNVLIVDDICDGGKTFTGLAEELIGKGAVAVQLYVTHGIFSKGLAPFKGLIDRIYTTNSFVSKEHFEGNEDLLFVLGVGAV